MTSARVLLVNDHLETAHLWTQILGQRGIKTILAGSVEEALAHWQKEAFDLLIIDVHSPERNGAALCRQLRAEIINPILYLAPRSDEAHLLEVYQAGADECVAKPIGPALFLAKVKAWMQRSWTVTTESVESFQAGSLRLNPGQRQVTTADGSVVNLTNLEFRLLRLLMSNPNQVLAADTLIDRVWGYVGGGDNIVLKNVVYRLRRKIEPDPGHPCYIQTIAGIGYTYRSA